MAKNKPNHPLPIIKFNLSPHYYGDGKVHIVDAQVLTLNLNTNGMRIRILDEKGKLGGVSDTSSVQFFEQYEIIKKEIK